MSLKLILYSSEAKVLQNHDASFHFSIILNGKTKLEKNRIHTFIVDGSEVIDTQHILHIFNHLYVPILCKHIIFE